MANVDVLKRSRAAVRRSFTVIANQIEGLLSSEPVDRVACKNQVAFLEKKGDLLHQLDDEIYQCMLGSDACTEDHLAKEIEGADHYQLQLINLVSRYQELIAPSSVDSVSEAFASVSSHRHKFELPRLELKKLGGDVKEWLPFWSTFKKVHDDPSIPNEDKFQYLLQAVVPGSRAREVLDSFPLTSENYQKALDSLESRFGRKDLLVEVYVRELLRLILKNAMHPQEVIKLSVLYDQVETQLRALASLGVTTDKCAAILYPLVESCLPEGLIRVWQRSSKSKGDLETRLANLMLFMKEEVEHEEHVSLAAEGFGLLLAEGRSKTSKPKTKPDSVPTATDLLSLRTLSCVFCSSGSHDSPSCYSARKMSLEEKQRALVGAKCCFRCLKPGHTSKRCRQKIQCIVCGSHHVPLMCPQLAINAAKPSTPSAKITTSKGASVTSPETPSSSGAPGTVYLQSLSLSNTVFLQTLRVRLVNGTTVREVRALIDSGSQKSYVLESTAVEMGYPVLRTERLKHSLFGGDVTSQQNHAVYEVCLMDLDQQYSCKIEVLSQPVICGAVEPIQPGPWLSDLQKLGIRISDCRNAGPIELLMGADVAGRLLNCQKHELASGLVAVGTNLGWTLMGTVPESNQRNSSTMSALSLLSTTVTLEDLWSLEVLGITDPGEKKSRQDLEDEVRRHYINSVKIDEEGRYVVQMPWRDGHPPLPHNFQVAKKRLDNVVRKLKADALYDEYNKVFQEWERLGIIEEVADWDAEGLVHYLPHRPVIKMSSATTKIRPVFDASAHERGHPSLNDCLETGPNLIELIPGLLIRFRLQKIGVVSDITKAFLQVGLQESNRDFVRFLWLREDGELRVFRHRRVVFGVCCSPFLLGMTISYHLDRIEEHRQDSQFSVATISKLKNSFYVDNSVTSVADEFELRTFIREAVEIMARGSFELRGWEYSGMTSSTPDSPLLGLSWNRELDVISVSEACCRATLSGPVTKRQILSITQKVFDPLGFTCPTTLIPKLLLQETWKEKFRWDQELSDDHEKRFRRWHEELPVLAKLRLPRWVNYSKGDKVSLHTFSDASQHAYAAAVFLRVETTSSVYVSLLQASSRVSPLKKLSIPRLELLAATIGTRLCATVKKALDDLDVQFFFWTDSATVLAWIHRESEWTPFVWNRVKEIRAFSSTSAWRHVPGALNPADLPSRGCLPSQLIESQWWEGPRWLYGPPEEWPRSAESANEELVNFEKKKSILNLVNTSSNPRWYCSYFSSYTKTVRLMGWVLRFLHNSRRRGDLRSGDLSTEEFEAAERVLFRLVQEESINESVTQVKLKTLCPFKDESSLIRIKTKVSNRDDLRDFVYPILLPADHPVVESIIREAHQRSCHAGVQTLTCILRERFWILGGRKHGPQGRE